MKFYLMELLVDDDHPQEDFFVKVKERWEESPVVKRKDVFYVAKESENALEYFGMHLRSGSKKDYSPEVVDATDETIHKNPKTPDQVETIKDIFLFYLKNEKLLAIYPEDIRTSIPDIFNVDGKIVLVRRFLVSFSEFLEKTKVLKSIRFYSTDSLFRQTNDLTQAVDNMFGYGAQPQMKLDLDFKGARISDSILQGLSNLKTHQDQEVVKDLRIVGKDEEGFDTVFNGAVFNKCFEIEVNKDEFNHYIYSEVVQKIKEWHRL